MVGSGSPGQQPLVPPQLFEVSVNHGFQVANENIIPLHIPGSAHAPQTGSSSTNNKGLTLRAGESGPNTVAATGPVYCGPSESMSERLRHKDSLDNYGSIISALKYQECTMS